MKGTLIFTFLSGGSIAGRLDATAEFAGVDGVEVSIEVPVKEEIGRASSRERV